MPHLSKAIVFTGAILLFFCPLSILAEESETNADIVEGRIMGKDLSNNLLVVNEININLFTTSKDGQKYWQTSVINKNSEPISMENLNLNDWVKITGTSIEKYEFNAESIQLITKASEEETVTESVQQETTTTGEGEKEIYLQDGEWKN